jgi:hypothetical protein
MHYIITNKKYLILSVVQSGMTRYLSKHYLAWLLKYQHHHNLSCPCDMNHITQHSALAQWIMQFSQPGKQDGFNTWPVVTVVFLDGIHNFA